MSELKPCPFCGSTDVAANSFSIEASVRCFDCFAVIIRKHPRYSDGGLVAAITAWNARATDALLREAVAVLAKAQGQSCEGFCEQLPQADTYTPDMDLDCATCFLRPTLAKLREHLEGSHAK